MLYALDDAFYEAASDDDVKVVEHRAVLRVAVLGPIERDDRDAPARRVLYDVLPRGSVRLPCCRITGDLRHLPSPFASVWFIPASATAVAWPTGRRSRQPTGRDLLGRSQRGALLRKSREQWGRVIAVDAHAVCPAVADRPVLAEQHGFLTAQQLHSGGGRHLVAVGEQFDDLQAIDVEDRRHAGEHPLPLLDGAVRAAVRKIRCRRDS